MTKIWEHYCTVAKERLVRPLLVVQVEDGKDDFFSKTDLDQVVRALREEIPGISPEGIAHCFQDEGQLKADGIGIRKAEPSKLQDDPFAEVVLFKTALTTGWDCPRAETMMSYRTARDATMIEQLIGRMIRAPLARGIESNDALNTVRLYLPGFDRGAVQSMIKKLSDPENEESVATNVDEAAGYTFYPRNPKSARVFDAIPQLPSYVRPRRRIAIGSPVPGAWQLFWRPRGRRHQGTGHLNSRSIREHSGSGTSHGILSRAQGRNPSRVRNPSEQRKQHQLRTNNANKDSIAIKGRNPIQDTDVALESYTNCRLSEPHPLPKRLHR
jgi:hypothetical protein